MAKKHSLIPADRIENSILLIRGQKVILDSHLAQLYGVPTKRLVQAVKRNLNRFPDDFMFQLSRHEFEILRSQTVTSSWGGRRYPPYAFTEHGALMAANVLRSPVAVEMSIQVVRTFVHLREMLASHADLARKLEALERKYDRQFKIVFDAIRELMAPLPKHKKGYLGFRPPAEEE